MSKGHIRTGGAPRRALTAFLAVLTGAIGAGTIGALPAAAIGGTVGSVTLTLTPSSVQADGSSTSTASATVKDGSGTPMGGQTVAFGTSGDVTFSPANTCVTAATGAGTGSCSVTITASTTAGDSPEQISATAGGKSTSQPLTEYPVAGTVAVDLTPPQIVADGAHTSSAKATVKDKQAAPAPNVPVVFSTNGDATFPNGTQCTTVADGTCSVTILSSKVADTGETITATAGVAYGPAGTTPPASGTATLTEIAGPPTSVALVLGSSSITADGTSTTSATATVKDANGNPALAQAVTFTTSGDVTFTPSTGAHTGSCTTASTTDPTMGTTQGVCSVTIKASTTADTEAITATAGTASNSKNLTETAGAAFTVAVVVSPDTIPADGSTQSTATATVSDAHTNLVSGASVAFTTSGDVTFSSNGTAFGPTATCTTGANGACSVTIKSSKTSDDETITATTSNNKTGTATLHETGAAGSVAVTFDKNPITADGTSQTNATATTKDAGGNVTGGQAVSFGTNGDVTFPSGTTCTTSGSGTCSVPITASTTADSETITATANGHSGNAVLTENPGPASTINVVLTPPSVVANGTDTSTAGVTVTDAHANVISGAVVTFSTSGDVTFVPGTTCTTTSSGTCSVTVKASTTAGPETITAAIGGTSGSATLTETAGPAASVAVTLTPASISANGSDTSSASAAVADANGNPVGGAGVVFSTNGDVSFPGGTGCSTGVGGTCSVTIKASTTADKETITATAAGKSGAATLTENAPAHNGYWLVGQSGSVYAFGDAKTMGSAPVSPAHAVDIKGTPDGGGYWVLDDSGRVFAFGNAPHLGDMALNSGERATSISGNPKGGGYWIFTSLGRVQPFGTATFFGDMSGTRLNGPVIGSVATPTGHGYYMVATDGGIFTFGDAKFHGSMGDKHLNAPVVGLVPTPDGAGYWLDASDGGVFSFLAPFRGSRGGDHNNAPMIGMVAYGNGYLMVGSDGGVFDFSDKPFSGSLGASPPAVPIVNIGALPA